MLTTQEQYQLMFTISRKYNALKRYFEEFGNIASSKLQGDSCQVKGIKINLNLDKNFFDVSFASHTIRFIFSVKINTDRSIAGIVNYIAIDTLNEKTIRENNIRLGKFTFDENSKTDFIYKPENVPFDIDDSNAVPYIIFHCLYESMARESL